MNQPTVVVQECHDYTMLQKKKPQRNIKLATENGSECLH